MPYGGQPGLRSTRDERFLGDRAGSTIQVDADVEDLTRQLPPFDRGSPRFVNRLPGLSCSPGLVRPSTVGGVSRHHASPTEPWFRIGRFDIGTTEVVTIAAAVSLVLSAIVPVLIFVLALTPTAVAHGAVWQLVTWPLANIPSLGAVWSMAVFWWAGHELEKDAGRTGMAKLLGGLVLAQSVLAVGLSFLLGAGGQIALAGLSSVAMLLVLVYIAEHPRRPFFFNIPAWVIGAVIVGISVLSNVFARAWVMLLVFVVSLLVTAVLARTVGLLTAYDIAPWLRMPQRRARAQSGANVRYGPWEGSSVPQHETDELDALLDKIAANGLSSLTERERRRLDDLRKRRRGV